MSKEYIEREALKRYTKKDEHGRYYIESVNGKLEGDKYGHTYGEAIDRFAELENSAADVVEVVHGEWEDKQNPQWKAYDIRHCSVCGWNIPKSKLRNKDLHWNYCPNCGAKMDGERKEV